MFEPGPVDIAPLVDDRCCIYIFHLTMFNTAKLFAQKGVYIDIGQEAKRQELFFCKGFAPDATHCFRRNTEIGGKHVLGHALRD